MCSLQVFPSQKDFATSVTKCSQTHRSNRHKHRWKKIITDGKPQVLLKLCVQPNISGWILTIFYSLFYIHYYSSLKKKHVGQLIPKSAYFVFIQIQIQIQIQCKGNLLPVGLISVDQCLRQGQQHPTYPIKIQIQISNFEL